MVDQHIDKTCNKAKQRAAIILKCIKSRNPALLAKDFITYVRPILEYACNVWSSFKLIHIDTLEHVKILYQTCKGYVQFVIWRTFTKSWFKQF